MPVEPAPDELRRPRLVARVGDVTPRRRQETSGPLRLLMLDGAYSLDTIRSRGLEQVVTSRDLDGFFDHVWTVHPAVGASPEHATTPSIGRPSSSPVAPHHTMVEGKVGRFRRLQRFPKVNFAVGQALTIWYLWRLVRSEHISLIGSTEPLYLGMIGLLLARVSRLPLVVTIIANHDAMYQTLREATYPRLFRYRSVERWIERRVLASADMVVVGSEDNRRYALHNGARPDRVRQFRFGELIHPSHFQGPEERPSVREELGIGERPFLLTVCRLARVKHPEDVIEVFAEARKEVPSLVAVMVGDGPMRSELERRARELGVDDGLLLVGTRDQAWIAHALASASVIVSPVTGRALVEASLSGRPIVAYDFEWQSEFISSGHDGIVVPYRDTQEMAAAVCRLLREPALAVALGARARNKTLQTWSPEANKAEKVREFSRLLQLT